MSGSCLFELLAHVCKVGNGITYPSSGDSAASIIFEIMKCCMLVRAIDDLNQTLGKTSPFSLFAGMDSIGSSLEPTSRDRVASCSFRETISRISK